MSQATAINAVAQQISLATGVALAGGVLDIAGRLHGGGLALGDFHVAFLVVAAVAALSTITFFRLPPDAGAAVSGHRRRRRTGNKIVGYAPDRSHSRAVACERRGRAMLTAIHTLICFVAIGTGIVAIYGLFRPERRSPGRRLPDQRRAGDGDGFLFPFLGPTPAFLTGIVSSAILIVLLLARFAFGLRGWWRAAYAVSMVGTLYLLVFVLIAQA